MAIKPKSKGLTAVFPKYYANIMIMQGQTPLQNQGMHYAQPATVHIRVNQ